MLEQLDKYIAVGISDKVEEEWIKIEARKYEIEGDLEKYIQHINWLKGKITDFIIKSLLEPEKPDITKAEKDQIFEIRVNLSVGEYTCILKKSPFMENLSMKTLDL